MIKKKIYRIGKNLGLDNKDIELILNTPRNKSNIQLSLSIYKSGTRYGTISHCEIYKSGTLYGTINTDDF
jgi:hypothetical protein